MKRKVIFLFCLITSTFVFSQEALKGLEEDYFDFLALTGIVSSPSLGYRTLSDSVWTFSDEEQNHIWNNNNLGNKINIYSPENKSENWFLKGLKQELTLRVYGPEWFNSYNENIPYGQNDGSLWQGCGYNTSLSAGLRLEGYGFELTIKPQFNFSQNKDFEYISGIYGDKHSYNWGAGIDLVQRYGDYAFASFDAGDSEIRWSWHSLTFGFGNQNAWLGPATLNPMLGSNNAPGYTKFDAGLRKLNITLPFINIDLGYIEGRVWVGKLKESDYFDLNDSNNDRITCGMSASYAPSFIPGLTLGLNRVFVGYWRRENLNYILRLFSTSRKNTMALSGNDEDQKFSLFLQWAFPKVGFKVYGEFGRDDFSYDEKANPFHTAIYTVGAKQSIPLPHNLQSELSFEWNNFEMSQDFQLQWAYLGYYAHGFVSQGYTNKGQIIGAGTGYFGNSQFIQYKIYYPKGYTALKFHRHCPNNNSVYNMAVYDIAAGESSSLFQNWYSNFETYFDLGIESDYFITKDFNIKIGYDLIMIRNRNYVFRTNSYNNRLFLELKYIF